MGGSSNYLMLIVIVVVIGGMMWWQSRQSKKQQGKVKDFRSSLKPGDEVATYSGLLGTVESVDLDADQIVVNSEGSLSRWRIQAITEPPVVPNYVSDEEYEKEQAAKNAADADANAPQNADENVETVEAEPVEHDGQAADAPQDGDGKAAK